MKPSIQLYNQAIDHVQAGQLDDALTAIENSLTENPKDPQTWQLYAVILKALGQQDKAETAMAKVRELGLDSVDEFLIKAAEAAAEGKFNAAITHYEDALELDNTRSEIHVGYALVLIEANYKKDALDSSAKALELDPDNPSAWYARGRILRLTGQTEDALHAYTKAVEIDKNLIIAHYERGMILSSQGKLKEALTCFETVLEIHPEDENSAQAKATILQKMEELGEG